MKDPREIRDVAENESYEYFDKNIRPLPKDSSGKIDSSKGGFQHNDVDAFRHAYVSGIFTLEYNETVADVFGRLNEFISPGNAYSNATTAHSPMNKTKPLIVLLEDANGRNQLLYDTIKNKTLTSEQVVALINEGQYPSYTVKIIHGISTPVSKPDGRNTNNLG